MKLKDVINFKHIIGWVLTVFVLILVFAFLPTTWGFGWYVLTIFIVIAVVDIIKHYIGLQ